MRTLITGISELVTNDPSAMKSSPGAHTGGPGEGPAGIELLGLVREAALAIDDDGLVAWTGPEAELPEELDSSGATVVSAHGAAVIPGFVDSHNHLIFDGDRSEEFAARMAGQAYSAGGIRTTVAATRQAGDDRLEANLARLMDQARRSGTTTLEVKTGYGLTEHDEIRALEIIGRHTSEATLLAAHVVPPEFADDPEAYVALVIERIIPAAEGKARWIDVFCEQGAFTPGQTERIIAAGKAHGMRPRLHANQLTQGQALQLAARTGCVSADHATFASDEDLEALAAAGTVVTLLPGVEFSTRQPYPDARRYLAAGVRLAIASDCNPGSCFTSSLPFCLAIAVRDMRFTVEQALWAATAGGAAALDRDDVGRLGIGARGDFAILDAPSYRHLAYRPGVQQIAEVYIGGELVAANPSPFTAQRR